MDFTVTNWLAVIVAGLVPMAIGAAWYARPVFGDRWIAALGKSPDEVGQPGMSMIVAALAFILMSLVMSVLLPDPRSLTTGIVFAVVAWSGFVFAAVVVNAAFERPNRTVVMLFLGYMLVSMVVMGAILGAWV
jgi:hypothetical protein